MHTHVSVVSVKARKQSHIPVTGVIGVQKMPYLGAGNQTQSLHKSNRFFWGYRDGLVLKYSCRIPGPP